MTTLTQKRLHSSLDKMMRFFEDTYAKAFQKQRASDEFFAWFETVEPKLMEKIGGKTLGTMEINEACKDACKEFLSRVKQARDHSS